LLHDALHDPLTELPNRSLFTDRLDMALQRSKRFPRGTFAVLFMDLDHFKEINDHFGHGVGDQLLMAIASILRRCVRANDTVSRLGGDEFTILLDSPTTLAQAKQVADRILQSLTSPLIIEDQSITIGASIGLVLSANHYIQSAEVLRDADVALYQAKENGKGQSVVFTD
jgi:diguanylate cyclase (GGDEF)-like protein